MQSSHNSSWLLVRAIQVFVVLDFVSVKLCWWLSLLLLGFTNQRELLSRQLNKHSRTVFRAQVAGGDVNLGAV